MLSHMNPGSADQALDSVINVDLGWNMHQFYAGRETKPPDPCQLSSTMEMESSIINTANKQSRIIATPTIDSGGIGIYDLAAATKSELQMRRVAVSTIKSNVSAAGNISALQEFSSAFHRGLWAATASNLFCRGGVVKAKKKRERRSLCVPTKVIKTDTCNFKAMVQRFTGFPHTITSTTSDESIVAPAAFSYSPECISSSTSTSFSKPLPHPNVCKNSKSSTLSKSTTSMATTTYASPLLPPNFPTYQSIIQHSGQYNWP